MSVTLSDASTINTTDTVTGVEIGDEVTFTNGSNSGKIAHITALNDSGVVTAITLDTDVGTAGDTGSVEIDNWKLHKDSYTETNGENKQLGVGETSPWIQYKVVFDGDIEMRKFISKSNAKT